MSEASFVAKTQNASLDFQGELRSTSFYSYKWLSVIHILSKQLPVMHKNIVGGVRLGTGCKKTQYKVLGSSSCSLTRNHPCCFMVHIWGSFKWVDGETGEMILFLIGSSVISQRNRIVSARIQAILCCFFATSFLSSSHGSQFAKVCLQNINTHL